MVIGEFERSGGLTRTLGVETGQRSAKEQEEETGSWTDAESRFEAQLAFDLIVNAVPSPCPDRSVGVAEYLMLIGPA